MNRTTNAVPVLAVGPLGARVRSLLQKAVLYALLLLFAAIVLYPLIWMLYSAFKTNIQVLSDVFGLPTQLYLGNFQFLFSKGEIFTWTFNSVIVTGASVTVLLFLTSLAAYGFAGFKFRGQNLFFTFMLANLMVPPVALMIAGFKLMNILGLISNPLSLILTYCGWISFGILVMRNAFRAVPKEIREAAIVDGATHWQLFTRIMLPAARPHLATVAIFYFMWIWNDFIYPLVYMQDARSYTIQVGVLQFAHRFGVEYSFEMAALTFAAIVPLVVYLVFQRQFVRGILEGALKG